jgi:hypothetical protein
LTLVCVRPKGHHGDDPARQNWVCVPAEAKIDQLLSLFNFIYPRTCERHGDDAYGGHCDGCATASGDSLKQMHRDGIADVGDDWSDNLAAWLKEGCGYDLFDVYFTGVEYVSL